MTISNTVHLTSQLDLPAYLFGIAMLLVVMLVHGVALLQIAKRYEVKSFLYLSEHKYSSVAFVFYVSVLCLFLIHIFEIILWGVSLRAFNLLPNLGESILFSGSTYTAMGFMDDLLPNGRNVCFCLDSICHDLHDQEFPSSLYPIAYAKTQASVRSH
jgi:hypothetical protein